jgi:hypothetical protein
LDDQGKWSHHSSGPTSKSYLVFLTITSLPKENKFSHAAGQDVYLQLPIDSGFDYEYCYLAVSCDNQSLRKVHNPTHWPKQQLTM